MKRDKPPLVVVVKTKRGLSPLTAWDAEVLMEMPFDMHFDLVKRSKRSSPQNRYYWALLNHVVKATAKWSNVYSLHEELKFVCGYHRPFVNWETGEVSRILDSTAFDAMDHDEFKVYLDHAIEKLNEYLGWDVTSFMEQSA